ELVNEHDVLETQRATISARLAEGDERIARLERLLPALEQVAAVEADRAQLARARQTRLAERVKAVGALRRDVEVKVASLEQRRTMLSDRLAELESYLHRHEEERVNVAARRVQLLQVAAATGRLAAMVGSRVAQIEELIAALHAARRSEAAAMRALASQLDQLRGARSSAERRLSEVRERLARVQLDESEARIRLETLVEAIRRDLDCEPDSTLDSLCPPMPAGTSPTTRVRELERELRLMGAINPLALEEYTALLERHAFLEGQLDDVRSARRELGKVIRAVDAEIVEVFRAAFADVAENFERLFTTLFPGGFGRLRLTDPDHLLDTGIEVEARPSGKNIRRLSLLSGGERSLTALALLFAVFRSRPSPFYLMDEVEAALDDVNLHRFLDLLREFRDEAQLLVVSHQKRTMEAADWLYGVTMQAGGSSRVVSERIGAGA
ncbi:MAG: AAA family ATPase, partial [Actinomycetota bacterium]|nr:AAA family ATPase [Actinomycetota bacterium]